MIVLDLGGHASKEIQRIKTEAESAPMTVAQMQEKAENNDLSFPEHLTMIVPQGWHVGYIVEEQPEPYGTWRRLRVTLNLEVPPPQAGIIKLMEAFEFICAPDECLWVPEPSEDIAIVCVMEPIEGRAKMMDFQRRMMIAEQINSALGEVSGD